MQIYTEIHMQHITHNAQVCVCVCVWTSIIRLSIPMGCLRAVKINLEVRKRVQKM